MRIPLPHQLKILRRLEKLKNNAKGIKTKSPE